MNSILYVGMDVYKENYTLCCYSFDRDKVEYERSEARQGYRSGHYDRNLTTTSGDVTLHVPRFKGVPFETAIIERYRRRESNVSSKPRMNIELRRATMCGNTPKSFSCRSCL